jgi:hypothetical protein
MSTSTGLQFEYASGCLTVRATGRGMIEHKEASIKAIAKAIEAQPTKAVLVDMRGVLPPFSFMDRYQIGELTGKYLSGVPLAALALEEQTDKQRIGQLVAINRGARVEVFIDETAAYAWLKKHQASDSKK